MFRLSPRRKTSFPYILRFKTQDTSEMLPLFSVYFASFHCDCFILLLFFFLSVFLFLFCFVVACFVFVFDHILVYICAFISRDILHPCQLL